MTGGDELGLRTLVVDDEAPARDELSYLLREDPRVGSVRCASTAACALKVLNSESIDAVFCDIKMPGLDGVELAKVFAQFRHPPRVVFVTAYDDRAVDAFELEAVDYILKPVREGRLSEAIRRLTTEPVIVDGDDDEVIPVELGGVTRFIRRSQVRYVEAQGDYARLHTVEDTHLVRVSLTTLEERWSRVGFVRVHRSLLVCLEHVDEVRTVDGRVSLIVGTDELPVSRRHHRDLRDRLSRP